MRRRSASPYLTLTNSATSFALPLRDSLCTLDLSRSFSDDAIAEVWSFGDAPVLECLQMLEVLSGVFTFGFPLLGSTSGGWWGKG